MKIEQSRVFVVHCSVDTERLLGIASFSVSLCTCKNSLVFWLWVNHKLLLNQDKLIWLIGCYVDWLKLIYRHNKFNVFLEMDTTQTQDEQQIQCVFHKTHISEVLLTAAMLQLFMVWNMLTTFVVYMINMCLVPYVGRIMLLPK